MRDPVPVTNQHLGPIHKSSKRLKENRHLPKREQARQVGERGMAKGGFRLLDLKRRQVNHHG
jgi:hypothetical protein